MIFLTDTDFLLNAQLKAILVTNNADINTAEKFAIDEMSGYLSGRFNTAAIFAATGESREPSVVGHTAAMCLYHAQKKISPQNIPQWCKDDRNDAKQWATMILNNQLNPDLPLIASTTVDKGTFRFGGNKKVTHRT
jgi:hypothetical protein